MAEQRRLYKGVPPHASEPFQALVGALLFTMVAGARALVGPKTVRRAARPSAYRGRANQLPPNDRDDRGRSADRPAEMTKRGWWDILMRVKSEVSRTNLSLIAAGVSFYAFVAIPSTLTALISLYGLVADPGDIGRQIQAMEGVLPPDAVKVISEQLANLTAHPNTTLGIGFVVSLALALWSSRSAMSSVIAAINIAYEEEEKRSFIKLQLAAIALTVGAVLFVLLSLGLVAILPAVIDLLPLGQAGKTVVSIVRWPVLVALMAIGLSATYRFAPCRAEPKWRWVSWGAAIATILWIIGSALFSVYVSEFASYDKSYGSLGGVVVLLMWLYLSSFAVLLGAELNAELEHQTERDSTTGSPRPMGNRSARMADTLGASRS